jgi:Domain of unknown function (DUF4349)
VRSVSPDLAAALRADTPAAPQQLRARVASIAASAPPPRRFTTRRVLSIAVPAVAALSLAAAFAVGLSTAISPPEDQAAAPALQKPVARVPGARVPGAKDMSPSLEKSPSRTPQPSTLARDAAAPAPGPSSGRAEDYRAALTLLVDGTNDLSSTTQKALRTARRLGGYVVAVDYATPEPGEGSASVQLRIPVTRVQAAVVEFSSLGRILAQKTQIADLQQGLDDLTRRIRQLERKAAGLRGVERARALEGIAALRKQRTEINRRAAFARVDLTLTTREPQEPAPSPGRFERAVDDAVGILVAELAIAAYALIVAAPLLVLLVAAFFGNRAYRHYADQRLLERA